jgi:hypothetical protein
VTQPVQEPSPQRTDSLLSFGERQLRRRPAPIAEQLVPVFEAIQDTSFTTAADSADTVLLWDVWNNSDTTVFGHTTTGAKLNSVKLLQLPGLYSLTCGIQWAVNWNATARILLAGDYDFNQEQNFVGRAGGWSGNITFSAVLIFEAPFEVDDGLAQVQWQVCQHSGVNRTTDFGTQMQIHYLGPVDSTLGS